MTTLEKTKRTEPRAVEVNDPTLSDRANRALTRDLREAVGADVVNVPIDAPRHDRAPRGQRHVWAGLVSDRLPVVMLLATTLVVAAVVTLYTGSWWWLAVAVGIHLLASLAVFAGVMSLLSESERPAPETVARLEDEGVPDPERAFTELVDEFRGGR